MDVSRTHYGRAIQQQFDLIVLACAVFFGIVVTALSALLGIGQYGMGIGSLLASGVYVIWRRKDLVSLDGGRLPELTTRHYKLASTAFFVTLGAAVLLNYQYYQHRPPLFFALIAIAWTTLLGDILTVRRSKWLAAISLLKICTISIVFRATRYYEMATIPGNDTQFHLDLALMIYEGGELPAEAVVSHPQYIWTSVWHVGVATIRNVLGVGIWDTPFLAAAVPFVLITVFTAYGLAHYIGGTVAHGLTAALFISCADFMILRGASAIYTSSYVIPLTVVALLVIYRYHDWRGSALATLTVAVILLTHQLSAFAAVVIVGGVVVSVIAHQRYLGGGSQPMDRLASQPFLLATGIGMVGWWMMIPHGDSSFFEGMAARLIGALVGLFAASDSGGGGYDDSLAQYDALSNLLYNFGSDILFTLAVLGILLVAHRANQSSRQLYLFVPTLVMFTMIYPMTMLGLEHVLLPHRLLAFLTALLVLLAAIAVVHGLRQTSQPGHLIAVGAVVFVLVSAMITTPYINRNSPVHSENREPRVDLKDSEAEAAVWAIHHGDGADVYYDSHMHDRQFLTLANIHDVSDENSYAEYPDDEVPTTGLFIVREYFTALEEVPPRGTFGHNAERVAGSDVTDQFRTGSKTYNNGEAEVYSRGSGGERTAT